jgi:anti-anti-sigma factor
MTVPAGRQLAGGGRCVVVPLAGRVDIAGSGRLRGLLELEAAQARGLILLDLSRVTSMDWWAALILLWVARVVARRGSCLALVSPRPEVARVLRQAGASAQLPVYESIADARLRLLGRGGKSRQGSIPA